MAKLNPHVRGYQFGDCRLLGHLWHVVPSDWDPQFGVPMTTRCERCNVERRDTLDRRSGMVMGRRYAYPDGYQFGGVNADRRPRRDDFRLAWLRDTIDKTRQNRKANR